MDGIVFAQRPIRRKRIGKKRSIDPLDVKLLGESTRVLA
jgi:hypothetical protein